MNNPVYEDPNTCDTNESLIDNTDVIAAVPDEFSNDYSDNFQVKDFKASIRWVQKLKPIKSRFTVMLGTSAARHKFKPIVIGKSERPRCFKDIRK